MKHAAKANGTPRIPRQGETKRQRAIQAILAYAPDLLLMRNAQGRAGKGRAGLGTGTADLVGVLRVLVMLDDRRFQRVGRFFALEVKTPDGTLSDEQREWLLTVRLFGGFAAVVTSPEEALAALDRARKGASE